MPANCGFCEFVVQSLYSRFEQLGSEIDDSLRPTFEIFPFFGDVRQRRSAISTAWRRGSTLRSLATTGLRNPPTNLRAVLSINGSGKPMPAAGSQLPKSIERASSWATRDLLSSVVFELKADIATRLQP